MNKKLALISRNTEEVLTPKDLKKLITHKTKLRHYIGFEISGMIHLGTGLMSMGKIADFLKAGAECTVFLADWHTYINEKLDGQWATIKKVALAYFKEGMIASLKCFGVKSGQVNFVLATDLYEKSDEWQNLMNVSKHVTLSRVKRSLNIAGREAKEGIDFAKLIYPPLQVADIFTMKINLAHAGMDQRKAHVIARKVAKFLNAPPPVAIHHPLLYGLQKPPIWPIKKLTRKLKVFMKMSKSRPKTCIFIHDSPQKIRKKIKTAFCPPKNIEYNPIINWAEHLAFWGGVGELKINRPLKFGGNKTYHTINNLKKDYKTGQLHPIDLKNAMADWLIAKLEPARRHFEKGIAKKGLKLMEKIS